MTQTAGAGFFDRLSRRAQAIDSLICVGIDPHPEDLVGLGEQGALEFARGIVDATKHAALAFKPNSAFFEALGPSGMRALQTLVTELEPDVPVILDAKRGDIGSTSRAYARAAFDTIGASAITVSPFLGWEALAPFVERPDRAAFVLCRTSNPGAAQLQHARLSDGRLLFEAIAEQAADHAQADRIGLVAAGTTIEPLRRIRRLHPDGWLLVPGIGAQGGDARAAVAAGLRTSDGLGLLVSASRSIARAADPTEAVESLRDSVRAARDAAKLDSERCSDDGAGAALGRDAAELADALLATGCVQFGSFVLKSGLQSPIYLDLRRLSGSPQAMWTAARAYRRVLATLSFDRVAALPYAGLPLATAACMAGEWPMIYPRKEIKDHGARNRIEGPFAAGETAVVVDDLATRGTSVREMVPSMTAAGLRVRDVVVLVDRNSGADNELADVGLRLHSVVGLRELLVHWRATNAVDSDKILQVQAFLADAERPR